jgi:hypothetical protein
LSPEQLAEERFWHDLYERKVGSNCNYDEAGIRTLAPGKPVETASEYYEAYKHRTPRDFSGNVVLGWFEVCRGGDYRMVRLKGKMNGGR